MTEGSVVERTRLRSQTEFGITAQETRSTFLASDAHRRGRSHRVHVQEPCEPRRPLNQGLRGQLDEVGAVS